MSRKYRKVGLLRSLKESKQPNQETEIDSGQPQQTYDKKQCEEIKRWISLNFNEPLEIIVPKWKQATEYRVEAYYKNKKKSVTDVLEAWPSLRVPCGYTLIEINFSHMFPSAAENLVNWDLFCAKVIPYFAENVKDLYCKSLVETLTQSEHLEDGKKSCDTDKINLAIHFSLFLL